MASLLLIHDLYPIDLETRVREALATVRPYMESHGGDVELLGLDDGVARLRLVGHCKGCPASAATLELAIKEAIDEAAPDLAGLEVEGVGAGAQALRAVARAAADPDARRRRARAPTPTWMALDAPATWRRASCARSTVRGAELIVANVDGTLLAYRSACAGCRRRPRRRRR